MLKTYLCTKDTLKGSLEKSLAAVRKRSLKQTDICDHLENLFLECLGIYPRLIVELGCGDGESTFVLERVAKLWQAPLVSVDINDRREVGTYAGRLFIQSDDIELAKRSPSWCEQRNIPSLIDLLFVDTSHVYEHTVQEIDCWFPLLAPRCKVIFHDTNLREVFVRKDGSTGRGWDNERGVIRAIEERFRTSFDENANFTVETDGWLIRHFAHCNGLMVMDRYGR
jgi:cephalosporin hydroxylase